MKKISLLLLILIPCGLAAQDNVLMQRSSVLETERDLVTDNGFRSVQYPGQYWSSMLSYSPNSSTGTFQLEAFYWGELRFRNKTDGTTWTPWKTIFTTANFNPAGYLQSLTNSWNSDIAQHARMYFAVSSPGQPGSTIVKGYGDYPFEVRNGSDQPLLRVNTEGGMVIGAMDPQGHKLAVAGSVIAEKVKVKLQAAWPDYVFNDEYPLRALHALEAYIHQHKHLPDIPAASEVAEKGVDLGEMNQKLLQKVEELTLYIIQQNKEMKAMQERLAVVEGRKP